MGSPVSGLRGVTVNVTVNVTSVVLVFVKVNVGFSAEGLLMVELTFPPLGGETVQLYCKSSESPLQFGGIDAFSEATVNTEQPDVGVSVNAQVGGGITQIVLWAVSPPQPLAIICDTVYVPAWVNVTGTVEAPGDQPLN